MLPRTRSRPADAVERFNENAVPLSRERRPHYFELALRGTLLAGCGLWVPEILAQSFPEHTAAAAGWPFDCCMPSSPPLVNRRESGRGQRSVVLIFRPQFRFRRWPQNGPEFDLKGSWDARLRLAPTDGSFEQAVLAQAEHPVLSVEAPWQIAVEVTVLIPKGHQNGSTTCVWSDAPSLEVACQRELVIFRELVIEAILMR